jgi:hypothetical protein
MKVYKSFSLSDISLFGSQEALVQLVQENVSTGMKVAEVAQKMLKACSCWFENIPLIGRLWKFLMTRKISNVAQPYVENMAQQCAEMKEQVRDLSQKAQGVSNRIRGVATLYNMDIEKFQERFSAPLANIWKSILFWASKEKSLTFSDLKKGHQDLHQVKRNLAATLNDLVYCEDYIVLQRLRRQQKGAI